MFLKAGKQPLKPTCIEQTVPIQLQEYALALPSGFQDCAQEPFTPSAFSLAPQQQKHWWWPCSSRVQWPPDPCIPSAEAFSAACWTQGREDLHGKSGTSAAKA